MASPATGQGTRPRSVLIAEDEDVIRETYADLLRDEGYKVTACCNGRDALAKLKDGGPSDVILLDLMMPVMDGWEFRVQQKQDPELAGIPVIAITADRSAKAKAIDADAYLSKPVSLDQLLSTVARISLAREREQMQARLIAAERLASLGTLAAGVAHEINNPLSYVIGNVEFAGVLLAQLASHAAPGDREPSDRARSALRDASEGLTRISTIVRDMRTFCRADETERAPVDLHRVLDASANIVISEIRLRARLLKEYGPVPHVLAAEGRLGQVFINLLVNAAHAIPAGQSERNTIRMVTRTSEAGAAIVEIIDSGTGIPPDVLGRIFEPFFTTKPVDVGTGLGLFICHGIVEAHAGRLEVESQVGQGTCFRVQLPSATSALASANAVEAKPASEPSPEVTPAKRARVLVVDDEATLCRLIERWLAREHDVTAMTSARSALERIAGGERFEVILSDMMMPNMTGAQLHAELLRIAPDQADRMIFMTGSAFTSDADAFLRSSSLPCLHKPFNATELARIVKRHAR